LESCSRPPPQATSAASSSSWLWARDDARAGGASDAAGRARNGSGSGVRAAIGERDAPARESVTAGPLKLPPGASRENAQSLQAWTSRLVAESW
jgi:hypothetical protein